MYLRNCFINEDGDVWKRTTLTEASKDLPSEPFDLTNISPDEVLFWKTENVRDLIAHYTRIRDADCSIPIILRSDGYPMDGWHRIIKALAEGLELTARRFTHDPEPDFRIQGEEGR